MKKQLLSAAVLLGLAGGATAVNLNDNGLGQVLLYPYYNIAGGKDSLFSVVNTTGQTKAVKVRINEGANTWEVLDYNVYLSPWDVYTFGLTMKGDVPSLVSYDTTCTMPNEPDSFKSGIPLNPANINEYGKNEPKSFAKLDVTKRMMEGHIEVIEMGVVTNTGLAKGVKHGSDNKPADCSVLDDHFTTFEGVSNIPLGSSSVNGPDEAPSGGLFGDGIIVDVAKGSAFGYEATAIDSFFTAAVHTDSGESYPNVAGLDTTGNRQSFAATKNAQVIRDGKIMDLTFDAPIQALGAVLMADKVYNTFDIYSGTESATDWVITFPTKHAHVNPDTIGAGAAAGQYGVLAKAGDRGAAPFAGFCNTIRLIGTNREEQRKASKRRFSPATSTSQELCYETNLVQFAEERKVVDSILSNVAGVPSTWNNGWAEVQFPGASLSATGATITSSVNGVATVDRTSTVTLLGLPVTGFSLSEARNVVNKDNSKGFYSTALDHRYNRGYVINS